MLTPFLIYKNKKNTALVTVFILVLKLKIRGQYLQPGACTWQGVWVWIQCWPGITHPRFASLPANGSVNYFKSFFPDPSSSWKLALGSPLIAPFLRDLICSCGFNLHHNADYSPIWVSIPIPVRLRPTLPITHWTLLFYTTWHQLWKNYCGRCVGWDPQANKLPCGFLISPWGSRAGEGLILSSVCFQALLRLSSSNRWKRWTPKRTNSSRIPQETSEGDTLLPCVKMFYKLSCWKLIRVRLK